MNWIFLLLILSAYGATMWQQWQFVGEDLSHSPMSLLTQHVLTSANEAVTLSIGMIGVLAMFLGLMRIAEDGGLLDILGKLIYPLLKSLFPEIPANHPAFGAMTLNLSANMMGLGNAATPFGLKAMQELEKLNPHPGVASNAMVLFLAINTASITLLPTKVITLRASAGSLDPGGIIGPTLVATLLSTMVAIISAKLLQKLSKAEPLTQQKNSESALYPPIKHYPAWASLLFIGFLILLIPITLFWGKIFSPWIIPSLVLGILLFGMLKKVEIYQSFVEGAKGGFELAIKIIPYLVAILMAIGMFRASGAFDVIIKTIGPYTRAIGLPPEALPMVLMRPLSGSGSFGILSDILTNPALGPDSYVGYLVSTIMGSTETTFYVLAVYFGAVQIRRIRHALAVGLITDIAGIMASVLAVNLFLR